MSEQRLKIDTVGMNFVPRAARAFLKSTDPMERANNLSSAFLFSLSPQGLDYWLDMCDDPELIMSKGVEEIIESFLNASQESREEDKST